MAKRKPNPTPAERKRAIRNALKRQIKDSADAMQALADMFKN